jgi:hypothetical protein
MHVTLDPADAYSSLTAIAFSLLWSALDNAKRFVEDRDAMLETFVLTAGSG